MSKMIWVVLAVAVLLMASGANAADYNVALLGYGIMGTNSVSSGLTFGSLERLGGYPLTRINDGDTGSNTLTWNGALNATYDFGGILFPYVVNGVTNLTINQYIGPDGGWWGDTTNNRTGAVAPALQVTYDYGKSWSTVASSSYTNDYYSVISPRGLGSGLAPVATFTLNSALNGISGIRLFGDGGGTGQGGFIWISEIGVTTTLGVPTNIAVLAGATGLKGNNANDDGSMGTVQGTPGEYRDKNMTTTSDTWGGSGTYDFVGVTFDSAKSNVTSIAVQVKQFADGGWWSSTANNSNPLAAGDLLAPKVQVRVSGSTTWTDVTSTNAYVTQMTGVPLPGDQGIAAPFVVFTLNTPADNITGIRLFGNGGGSADGGFLGAREVAVMTGTTEAPPAATIALTSALNATIITSGSANLGATVGNTGTAALNYTLAGVLTGGSGTVGAITPGLGTIAVSGAAQPNTFSLTSPGIGLNTVQLTATDAAASNSPQTINTTLTVFDHADAEFVAGLGGIQTPSANALEIDFGSVLLGSDQDATLSMLNVSATYRAGLDLDLLVESDLSGKFVLSGDATAFTNLATGFSEAGSVAFDTSALGTFLATYTFSLSDQDGPSGSASIGNATLTVRGIVTPEPATLALLGLGGLGMLLSRKRK